MKRVRSERDSPNSMWQIDGIELGDRNWLVLVVDDCNRYCVGITIMKQLTTDNIIDYHWLLR